MTVDTENKNEKEKPSDTQVTADTASGENVSSPSAAPLDASETEAIARDIKEGRLSCFVGNGTTLSGELNFKAMARVDGHLTGKVVSENGMLIVGKSGQLDANVSVATAVVNGLVNGDILTSEHLELKSTARVVGNIKTPRLVMEDGAVLEGNCGMLRPEERSEMRAAQPLAPSVAAPTVKNVPPPIRPLDNQAKDKKPFEPVEKNKDSSKLTLEVV